MEDYSPSGSSRPPHPSQRLNSKSGRCESRPLGRSDYLETHATCRDLRCLRYVTEGEQDCYESTAFAQSVYLWDLRTTVGDTGGCPSTNMIASVGIATDCSYTSLFNSIDDVVHNVVSMINSASEVFERSFNITLKLNNLEVSESVCLDSDREPRHWNIPCSNGSLFDRLDKFSIWRATRTDNNAFWTLMTGCSGAGIGVAWLGQLCNTDYVQYRGTGATVVAATGREWQVFAYVPLPFSFRQMFLAH
jgi:hypothetical protein